MQKELLEVISGPTTGHTTLDHTIPGHSKMTFLSLQSWVEERLFSLPYFTL